MTAISSPPVAGTEFQNCADFREVKADQFEGVAPDIASEISDREEQIRQAGLDMQAAYWRYETSNGEDIGDLAEAHRHRIRMTALIAGRLPEYVAKLERERGIA